MSSVLCSNTSVIPTAAGSLPDSATVTLSVAAEGAETATEVTGSDVIVLEAIGMA